MLKPFLPQLQTTFIKALNDPNREVRMCAAKALQKLIKLHTRVDPLFTELHNGVKNTEDNTIRLENLPDFVFSTARCWIVLLYHRVVPLMSLPHLTYTASLKIEASLFLNPVKGQSIQ